MFTKMMQAFKKIIQTIVFKILSRKNDKTPAHLF